MQRLSSLLTGSLLSMSFQAVVRLIFSGICFDFARRFVCDINRCLSQDMSSIFCLEREMKSGVTDGRTLAPYSNKITNFLTQEIAVQWFQFQCLRVETDSEFYATDRVA